MAGYLRNPDSIPIEEDINLVVEALDSVDRASSLQIRAAHTRLQAGNLSERERVLLQDEIATARALIEQAVAAKKVIREKFLRAALVEAGLGDLNLDPADEDALDATRAFKLDRSLDAFVRQADPNIAGFERQPDINAFQRSTDINAFSLSGALTAANKEVKAITEIYNLVLKILTIAGPLVGIRLKSSVHNAAFESKSRNSDRAGTGPLKFYEPLFTDEALAYVGMQGDTPDADDIKALRDISLIHFFEKSEASLSEEYTSARAGFVNCSSQRQEGIASMVVGGAEEANEVSLWKNDSKLSWYMIDETFQTQEEFSTVESAMYASTGAWNKIKPGGVHFERAEKAEDAVFNVRFQKGGGNKEAVAFFPTEHVTGLSAVRVFENALKSQNSANLSNVLCHELGHVLGFRHEFALEKERSHQAGDSDGKMDPNSVMSYNYPPKLTMSDVKASRNVYKKFVDGTTMGLDDGKGRKNEFKVIRVDPKVGAL